MLLGAVTALSFLLLLTGEVVCCCESIPPIYLGERICSEDCYRGDVIPRMALPCRGASIRAPDIFAILEREGILALLAATLMLLAGGPMSEVRGAPPSAIFNYGCDYIFLF